MLPRLKEAKYRGDYRIWLSFTDGVEGEIDLFGELWGEIFEPLKDKDRFKKFELNAELDTITWPNGADFAPEFLYQKLRPDYKLKSTHRTGTD
ncbi:DUF2442 domain-containing protein [Thiohalophilus sp.]|uniref:DUF2442 domain-containing protein n=1 Tax=Thiohalophilus sp. TaxID=3028392 RepID=UPI002ACDA9C3|nr:DUF2442 domain-containing protein [Thiohalophilus sp.]MDZ7660849.1 DUF2442 domain-containing protein [Thiohalophilus sp.]